MSIDDRWEYSEKEVKTYEVVAKTPPESGSVAIRVIYRFWEAGDGDWKLQIINPMHPPMEPIFIPEIVIRKMVNVSIKEELKK